eukprot:jgi/Ulvmu1/9607/UM054_0037.1
MVPVQKPLDQWVKDLIDPDAREMALLELSKQREKFPELAPYLWNSFGTMAVLLQEITMIYPQLHPPELNTQTSNRVCNALALFQCVASHSETRELFLQAHIPLFLYPFLNTTSKTRPFEYLRLTALGVIGALVKQDDSTSVINFLLSTEIIPLCLRTMEMGTELSRTVATFIVQKILTDELGLSYICATPERFFAVGAVLTSMVDGAGQGGGTPTPRLLKHILRCYLRLVDNPRAKEALKAYLPKALLAAQFPFRDAAESDSQLKQLLTQLRTAVGIKDGLQMEQPPMHSQQQQQVAVAQQGAGMDRNQMGGHGGMMPGMHQPAMSMAYSAFQPMNFRR